MSPVMTWGIPILDPVDLMVQKVNLYRGLLLIA